MVEVGEAYNVKKCDNCGAGAKTSDSFCVACGAKFSDAPEHNTQADASKLDKITINAASETPMFKNTSVRNYVSKYALRGLHSPAPKTKLKPTFIAFLVIIVACFAIWVLFSTGIRTLLR